MKHEEVDIYDLYKIKRKNLSENLILLFAVIVYYYMWIKRIHYLLPANSQSLTCRNFESKKKKLKLKL